MTAKKIIEIESSMHNINSKIHKVTSLAPEIERVLVATLKPPFTRKITMQGENVSPTKRKTLDTVNSFQNVSTDLT